MHPWIRHLLHPREHAAVGRKVTPGQREATAALRQTTEDAKEIKARRSLADAYAERLRELRETNHFAEQFDELFRGGS